MRTPTLWLLAATMLLAAACNKDGEIGEDLPDLGKHYRPATAASSADCNRVFDYTPAPGQFINETRTGGFDATITTPAAAIAYAEKRIEAGNWVSLGAFGGYIVVGFDHSIVNSGGYDFSVIANSFSGSSEPGIVWVMQDENGNGQPDDTWYELKGSETGKATRVANYAVTYTRPEAKQATPWSDNHGRTGSVLYLAAFHNQDYYYPAWITADSYTLQGTQLLPNNEQSSSTGMWNNKAYEWGYADNFSTTDRLTTDSNMGGGNNSPNHFKISNAVDASGNTKALKFIDFVKIQSAILAQSGPLGEVSTEVCGVVDDHPTYLPTEK